MKKWISLALALALAGCSGKGSEFEGKWQDVQTSANILTVERDGDLFELTSTNPNRRAESPESVKASLKGTNLITEDGSVTLVYEKSDDTLTVGSVFGGSKFTRLK